VFGIVFLICALPNNAQSIITTTNSAIRMILYSATCLRCLIALLLKLYIDSWDGDWGIIVGRR